MAMTPVARDAASAEFFDATAQGRLVVRQCSNGHYLPPIQGYSGQVLVCPDCGSREITWVPASGRATLISWTVIHGKGVGALNVAGIVELAEGSWMNSAISVASDATLSVGDALTVEFVPVEGGEVLPAFRPI